MSYYRQSALTTAHIAITIKLGCKWSLGQWGANSETDLRKVGSVFFGREVMPIEEVFMNGDGNRARGNSAAEV